MPIGDELSFRPYRQGNDREKQSRRKLFASSLNGEHPCQGKPTAPEGNWTPKVSPLVGLRDESRLLFRGASPSNRHTKTSIRNSQLSGIEGQIWTEYQKYKARHSADVPTLHRRNENI